MFERVYKRRIKRGEEKKNQKIYKDTESRHRAVGSANAQMPTRDGNAFTEPRDECDVEKKKKIRRRTVRVRVNTVKKKRKG